MSLWQEMLFGVPQGSILGALLFNIFLADLFFTLSNTEIANYADDTTTFVFPNNINDLSIFGNNLLHDNLLKSNPRNRSIKNRK